MDVTKLSYEKMVEDALRGVLRQALKITEAQGLPGSHHFYITFDTTHPDVDIAQSLRALHPNTPNLLSDLAEAARARSGPSGLSAYVAGAVARQIERDNLNELISVAEAEHGAITTEELQQKRDALQRAREEQHSSGTSAA